MTTLIINNKSKKSKLSKLKNSYNNKIIIMYVYADWCVYCHKFRPKWEDYKKKINNNSTLKNKILFVELESEYIKFRKDNKILDKLLKDFKLYPTVIFSNNSEISYLVGNDKIKNIEKLIKKSIKVDNKSKK